MIMSISPSPPMSMTSSFVLHHFVICVTSHFSLSDLPALCSLLQSSNREIQQSPDATLGKMLSKEETTTLRSDEKISEVRASRKLSLFDALPNELNREPLADNPRPLLRVRYRSITWESTSVSC